MSLRNPFRILTALLTLTILLAACSSDSPKNEPVQIVATPSGDIELVEAFATYDPTLLSSGTPMPNAFPSRPEKVYLGIKFKKLGPDVSQFKMDYDLTYKGISLDTEYDSHPTSWTEQISNSEVVILPVRMADNSPFADGPYQAKLSIDGQLIALLNFTIGNPTPSP